MRSSSHAVWWGLGRMRLRPLLAAGLVLLAAAAQAEPTRVEVRVLSQGAKFMGDGTGGARVRLIDVATGAELAVGVTRGGTGDTRTIMESCGREPAIATPDAAAFSTHIDIDEPTRVRAEVEGPLGIAHVQARASAERWLLPGLGTGTGDGWVLELPGVAVTIRQPAPAAALVLPAEGGIAEVTVVAEVMMLCGCPITPGGLWDAGEQRVAVSARGPGGAGQGPVALQYGGEANRFIGVLPLDAAGEWTITVTAFNTRTGATGVSREVWRVRAPSDEMPPAP